MAEFQPAEGWLVRVTTLDHADKPSIERDFFVRVPDAAAVASLVKAHFGDKIEVLRSSLRVSLTVSA